PTCVSYDPAYAYEVAVVIQDGIRRMYEAKEDIFYYLTVYNENYAQPAMPDGVEQGIVKGLYRLKPAENAKAIVHLFGSGSILNEAIRAQQILKEKYGIEADVWSATSYGELRRDALACERWNRLHPAQPSRTPYLLQALDGHDGPIVAASDYMKILADGLAHWLPSRITALGTDGFGRSENRQHLRRHFEVDAENIAAAAISRLAQEKKVTAKLAAGALRDLGIDPDKRDAANS
ncbi:MAG: pyruvate dehydrogenase (acetyl-transferring), homodimeric type, partial [Candidatus Acidiferrales bacterium]